MTRLFIHRATRVIRRAATVEVAEQMNLQPGPDEEMIDVPGDWDLRRNDRFWKVGANNQPEPATDQEVDDADVDEAKVAIKQAAKRKAVFDAVNQICDATPPTMPMVKQYFVALRNLRR